MDAIKPIFIPNKREPWTREDTLADGNLPEDIDELLYEDMNGDYI